jgi:catechol 2,3-dioxygenase-like lactoylglutathione lyase family enzyme
MTGLTLDHVAIPVRDAARSRTFYEGALGLPLVSAMSGDDWEGRAWILMFFGLADGRQLALSSFGGPPMEGERGWPADGRHYAFGAAELETWRARLTAARVEYREENHGPQQSLFLEDPDGTILEITCPPTSVAYPTSDSVAGDADHIVRDWAARRQVR